MLLGHFKALASLRKSALWSEGLDTAKAAFIVYVDDSITRECFGHHIHSILNQTESNIAIVIVCDVSSSSYKQELLSMQRVDPRISIVTFPFSVGIPALAWDISFLITNFSYYVFSLCDGIYAPNFIAICLDAVQNKSNIGLIAAPPVTCSFGLELPSPTERIPDNPKDIFLSSPRSLSHLLIKRTLIIAYGLFDPRIIFSNFAVMDFVQRLISKSTCSLAEKSSYRYNTRSTSAENKLNFCKYIHWIQAELSTIALESKDLLLRLSAIKDCNIVNIPSTLSPKTRRYSEKAISSWLFSRSKAGYQYLIKSCPFLQTFCENSYPLTDSKIPLSITHAPSNNKKQSLSRFNILVIVESLAASEQLVFLPLSSHLSIIFRHYHDCDLALGLDADLIIFSRDTIHNQASIALAIIFSKIGKKVCWYADDNFPALSSDPLLGKHYSQYTIKKLEKFLSPFTSIISTSHNLRQYYQAAFPSKEHILVDPVYSPTFYLGIEQAAQMSSPFSIKRNLLRLAFMGQSHRHPALLNYVLPALSKLASDGIKVELYHYSGHDLSSKIKSAGLSEIALSPTLDYSRLLRDLKECSINIVIHPKSNSSNSSYKTPNSLLTATMIGAILLASPEDQYNNLPEGLMSIANNSAAEWHNNLLEAICSDYRNTTWLKAHKYCSSTYSSSHTAKHLCNLLSS